MEIIQVETSLLNVEKENIIQTIYDLEVAGTNYFHIDVMDGKFVENNTIEKMQEYSEYLKNITNIPMNVHLMVEDVPSYVKSYLALEPNMIIFHIEACKNEKEILEQIKYIKENNCKVGLSIKPATPIEKIYEYLPYIHSVLVMTVEPGKGGQELLPETIEKIFNLNKFIYENGYEVDIIVDGGINNETAKVVTDAGANKLVVGSYIINSDEYKKAIEKLKGNK